MAYAIADPVEILHQGPNHVLAWIAAWDEYRIPMSHIGYASTLIRHCPWCGRKLAESKQRHWYERLHSLGYHDPGNDDIPAEFETDRWWRSEDHAT